MQAIKTLPEFVPHQRLVWEYAELFRIGPPLNARKLLRIIDEIREVWTAGRFIFHKRTYEITKDGLAAAMRTVCNHQFKGPLSNHNYLKKVAIEIAENEAKERRNDEEKKSRAEHEDRGRGKSATGMEAASDVPGKVRELLAKIGAPGAPAPLAETKDS